MNNKNICKDADGDQLLKKIDFAFSAIISNSKSCRDENASNWAPDSAFLVQSIIDDTNNIKELKNINRFFKLFDENFLEVKLNKSDITLNLGSLIDLTFETDIMDKDENIEMDIKDFGLYVEESLRKEIIKRGYHEYGLCILEK